MSSTDALRAAIVCGEVAELKDIIKRDGLVPNVLAYAIEHSESKEVFDVLLDNGASVTAACRHVWTPLGAAIIEKNLAAIESLIAHGADVNCTLAAAPKVVDPVKVLEFAAQCADKEIVAALIGTKKIHKDTILRAKEYARRRLADAVTLEILLKGSPDTNAYEVFGLLNQ